MSVSRKLRRGIENKRKKNIKKSLKTVSKRLNSLGGQCVNCKDSFDRLNPEHLSLWKVYVNDSQPSLICPVCQTEVEAMKKEIKEAEAVEEEPEGCFIINV